MKLIERYILRRASLMFVATLVPLLGIVWVTQALTNINLVTDSGQSTFAFLKLATLILPSVIPIILPFALVIVAFLADQVWRMSWKMPGTRKIY